MNHPIRDAFSSYAALAQKLTYIESEYETAAGKLRRAGASIRLQDEIISEGNERMLEALNQAGWFTRE